MGLQCRLRMVKAILRATSASRYCDAEIYLEIGNSGNLGTPRRFVPGGASIFEGENFEGYF